MIPKLSAVKGWLCLYDSKTEYKWKYTQTGLYFLYQTPCKS